jgi:drug/metabolite transporter (DMT)-like permease
MTDNTKGALLMIASMLAFLLNDAFVKSLAGQVPLFQVMFVRGCFASTLLCLLVYSKRAHRVQIQRSDKGLITLRTLAEMGATMAFLTALFNMPLANATAILQVVPLIMALVVWLVFGESFGWRRALAIIVGLFGVLLIIQPGSDGFDFYALLALLAVAMVVVRDVATRSLSHSVPSIVVAAVAALGITGLGAVGSVLTGTVALTSVHYLTLISASVFLVAGYLLAVMVMRIGEVAFVNPFRYTALLWGLGLGYFVFGEVPDRAMISGSILVVGMGVFMFYRQAKTPSQRRAN